MSEKLRLDRKIGFQNTFYTKCINVVIDSIGPSIILRSIFRRLAKALIRLHLCAGWSESSLVAQTTLLEISCHGSNEIVPGQTAPKGGCKRTKQTKYIFYMF